MLNEAHDVLSDPLKRARHDAGRRVSQVTRAAEVRRPRRQAGRPTAPRPPVGQRRPSANRWPTSAAPASTPASSSTDLRARLVAEAVRRAPFTTLGVAIADDVAKRNPLLALLAVLGGAWLDGRG